MSQTYVGLRQIPVDRIVGSLDRSVDFNRNFRPRTTELADRLEKLRRAFPDGNFPAISVYEVGGAYFVIDGHHRVALSRQLGMIYLDAEVVRLDTEYEISDDVDELTLVHTEQQRRLMRESGLEEARPEATFELIMPDSYEKLLAAIRAYAYQSSVASGRLLTPAEIAADWYDNEYLPAVEAIHQAGLNRQYTYKTDADLFLWIYDKRRALEPLHHGTTWLEAAQAAMAEYHGPLAQRRMKKQRRQPLPRRSEGASAE
jgi:hypothetical protein